MADLKGTKSKVAEPPEEEPQKKHFDHDGWWKDLISRFFYWFLARAIPSLARDMDRKKAPVFLDKERRDVLQSADKKLHQSPYFVDYLIRVPLKGGSSQKVLLHIEVQGRGGDDLPFRMMHYCALIFARHRELPVALTLLTEGRPKDEGHSFTASHYGTSLDYRYNVLNLLELSDKELLSSDNPFDLALYGAQCALRSRKKERQKYLYLKELTKELRVRGWSKGDRRDLFLFIARIINLEDPELQERFFQEIKEDEKTMPQKTFIEDYFMKEGLEKGIAEGRAEGKVETARAMLARGTDIAFIADVTGLSRSEINALEV